MDDAATIRALRAQSNEAIVRQDVAGILSIIDDEFHVTAGGGAMFDGAEAMGVALADLFERFDDIVYVRTPDTIDVAADGDAAAEVGAWVGTWTAEAGPVRVGGTYSAYWRSSETGWVIRSEIFVSLFCEGPGCA